MRRLLATALVGSALAVLPLSPSSALSPPVISSVTASSPYVRVDASHGEGSVTITATASSSGPHDEGTFVVRDAAGAVATSFRAYLIGNGTWAGQFSGYDEDWRMLPRGLYTLRLSDQYGTESEAHTTVRVEHLVIKTWTREPTAAGSMVKSHVGRCSTLRKPSRRGWTGSLGYYSNTRCAVGEPEGIVATRHRVRLPRAVRTWIPTLSVYGGAAKSRPTSTARVYPGLTAPLYVTSWAGAKIRSSVRWRTIGEVETVSIDGVDYARWQVGVGPHHKYDVKKFRITMRYGVWQ